MLALGLEHLGEEELEPFDLLHVLHGVADRPDLLEGFGIGQQLLFAGTGFGHVDGGVDAAVGHVAAEDHFGVAGPFELFEDHLVHPAAGLDEGSADDGEAAALLYVSSSPEEPLGLLQRTGLDPPGEDLTAGGDHGVVSPGEAGDAVEQYDDVVFVLHQSLGPFDDHLGHLDVPLRGLVKGGADDLARDRALHVRHLLGALVDEEDYQVHLIVVGHDGVSYGLEEHRLSGSRRGDDQTSLPLTYGGQEVHDPGGVVLWVVLQVDLLHGVEGGEVVEEDLVPCGLGVLVIDLLDLQQGEVAFSLFWWADLPRNSVALAEVKTANLGWRDVYIIRTWEVVKLGASQEAEAIGEDFKHAFAVEVSLFFRVSLQDFENQVLFFQVCVSLNFKFACNLCKARYGIGFKDTNVGGDGVSISEVNY